MKFLFTILILLFVSQPLFPQVNISDTFRLALSKKYPDSVKIDKLNQYVFQNAPKNPEIVLIYSDTAISLSEKMVDSIRLAFSYNRKGVALFYLGDYYGSLENYFLAMRIKESSGNKSEIWREYNNIGVVLRNLNQNQEALKYFNMAMSFLEKIGNENMEAIAWNNIGISLRGLKQFDEAKNALDKALRINIAIDAKQSIAQDYNNIGNVYNDQKDYKTAIEYYKKALEINTMLDIRYEQIQNLNNLGEAYLFLNDYQNAIIFLKKAGSFLSQTRSDQLKLNNLRLQSEYYKKINDYKSAFYYNSGYAKMTDSISFANRSKQFEQLKTLANAEKEVQKLEFLKKISSIQNEKIKVQRIIQIGTFCFIMLILLVLFIVVRNLKIKKKLNINLKEQSDELKTLNEEQESLNEELISTNDELFNQREELEHTLNSLQEAQKQLIQSEKMASLGVLAAGVAHEINNPLNFIQGGVLGLEQYVNENFRKNLDEISPMLNAIQVGVSRAAGIVTSLQHYSRSDSLPYLESSIHMIIDNCLIMLENQLKYRIEVVKNYTGESDNLICNEGKLHQVFLNIITNAIHAIEDKGTITITTKNAEKMLLISIEDTGSGISDENLAKIMDPFFTTKDPGKGTGLGLSITYNIIKEHHGKIHFDSKLDMGTVVTITLPVNN